MNTKKENPCFKYRMEHSLSQKRMGELCGVCRDVILDYENGRSISDLSEYKIKKVIEQEENKNETE